ncbi:MAG: hypothetical protein Q9218_001856 [Villophora microphyllina]
MERYRDGEGHGIPLEGLEYAEVVEPMLQGYGGVRKEEEKVTTLLSVDARIIPSSSSLQTDNTAAASAISSVRLYLRIQQLALPVAPHSTSPRGLPNALKSFSPFYSVCEHYTVQDKAGNSLLYQSHSRLWPRSDGKVEGGKLGPLIMEVVEKYTVENGKREEPEPTLRHCEKCRMDFELEVRNVGEDGRLWGKKGWAFVITKYLELGSSSSPIHPSIPSNGDRWSESLLDFLADRRSLAFETGEVRKAFEDAEGELDMEKLCERNIGLLRGRSWLRGSDFWKDGARKLGFGFLDSGNIKFIDALQSGLGLRNSGIVSVEGTLLKAVKEVKTSSTRVLLVLDGIDFLLAATEAKMDEVLDIVWELREHVHASIVSTSADYPLLQTQHTPLEIDHAAFLMSLAHQARAIWAVKGLDTGSARDVSGVMRISRGPATEEDADEGDGVEEKELLYFVAGDGGVRVFERGSS